MKYTSTRNSALELSACEAIVKGIAPGGGLFVPTEFLQIKSPSAFVGMPYSKVASAVLGAYLSEFCAQELDALCAKAYSDNFSDPKIAPLTPAGKDESVLELYHGPTLAFKDMALQIMPHLMSESLKKLGARAKVLILVATSGDTGKAALEGFCDVEGTSIAVFYPKEGVSEAQKLQMTTQAGKNVYVCGVEGNFDDAQTGVKRVFADPDVNARINSMGYSLSSANSINWGRLAPQIAYYFYAYAQLLEKGDIKEGEKINFAVPTGNFGNILAGYYAKKMGLPVNKLICASNKNDVLTDFFSSGTYDRNREFYKTSSPSMDILISSNLERLLFELTGRDAAQVAGYMDALGTGGSYNIGMELKDNLSRDFYAGSCDEEECRQTIKRVFEQTGRLLDPHTAVAQAVYERYGNADGCKTVVISTASPYKFTADVLTALGVTPDGDAFVQQDQLEKATGTKAPEALRNLKGKPVRFERSCAPGQIHLEVLEALYAQEV